MLIKKTQAEEHDIIYEMMSEEDHAWTRADFPYAVSNRETFNHIEGMHTIYVKGSIVGTINIDSYSNLGIWIASPYRMKGYATRAFKTIMRRKRRKQACRFFLIGTWVENHAMIRLASKLDFVVSHHKMIGDRKAVFFENRAQTMKWWARLSS